jgi:2-dehydro-3-deoxyphosphogluconate aldolase/(4S)-4-hydroxy-2-oxoglutarate aldolase
MTADEFVSKCSLTGIVPVVVLNDPEDAVPLAKAMMKGCLDIAEVTFRTDAAAESISRIAKEVPSMLVGAGTVKSVKQAQAALDAGAKFIVSAGFDGDVVDFCLENGVPVVPGVSTPTEIQMALKKGLGAVKIFPAGLLGGPSYLKSISGVYRGIRILPTGGVNMDNMNDFLSVPAVFAVGGSWICPEKLVSEKRFDEITNIIDESYKRMFDFKVLHLGVNTRSSEEASAVAGEFSEMFGLPINENPNSIFVGSWVEVLKGSSIGENGHLAISTRHMEKAINYFERKGYSFKDLPQDSSSVVVAYFEKEIGGFAVHLRRAD